MSTIRKELNLDASKAIEELVAKSGESKYWSCDELYKILQPICHFASKRDMGISMKELGYISRSLRINNIPTRCYFLK